MSSIIMKMLAAAALASGVEAMLAARPAKKARLTELQKLEAQTNNLDGAFWTKGRDLHDQPRVRSPNASTIIDEQNIHNHRIGGLPITWAPQRQRWIFIITELIDSLQNMTWIAVCSVFMIVNPHLCMASNNFPWEISKITLIIVWVYVQIKISNLTNFVVQYKFVYHVSNFESFWWFLKSQFWAWTCVWNHHLTIS